MSYQPTLDCQGCGAVLQRLTLGEAQEVAARPYDFVAYCRDCLSTIGDTDRGGVAPVPKWG